MSTTTAQINYGFKWVKSDYGGGCQQVEVPVKKSQTLLRGDAVILSYTSGSIRVAVEADTSLFGVMAHNKTTTASQGTSTAYVIPFMDGYVFEVCGAAGMSGGKPENVLGHHADLEIPTTNRHRIDTAGTINMFQIVGHHPEDKGLTTRGLRYWVKIRGSMTQWGARETEH